MTGPGDLVHRDKSPRSRNRQVGLGVTQGLKLEEIQASMVYLVEGVLTTPAAWQTPASYRVEISLLIKTTVTRNAG
ncbi:MAG: hypothetical protein HY871_04900 [Chloroflexi bacterium]|nr:hypothetical protein [Chloroflexota bacterium]